MMICRSSYILQNEFVVNSKQDPGRLCPDLPRLKAGSIVSQSLARVVAFVAFAAIVQWRFSACATLPVFPEQSRAPLAVACP